MPPLWADSLDEHRSLVLGRLLDAYEAVRADVGVDAVTLSAVAQRAGLARSALYNYVSDKHDLVLAHARRALATAFGDLDAAVAAADTPADKLCAYIHHTLSVHAAEASSADDLMPMLTPEERERFAAMLAPLRALLEEIVAAGIATGEFRGDHDDLVALVWATLGGYRQPVATGRLDPERTARVAADVLVRGMSGA